MSEYCQFGRVLNSLFTAMEDAIEEDQLPIAATAAATPSSTCAVCAPRS